MYIMIRPLMSSHFSAFLVDIESSLCLGVTRCLNDTPLLSYNPTRSSIL